MSEDQEVVKAVFVVLSKLRVIYSDSGKPPSVERLEDLEKALGVLAALCTGEERSDMVELAGRVESTREEIESISSEIRRKIVGMYGPMEARIVDVLMVRVPEEKRQEIQERLAKILSGSDGPEFSERLDLDDERSPRSGLEEKLKMLEDDEPRPGLDRYMDTQDSS